MSTSADSWEPLSAALVAWLRAGTTKKVSAKTLAISGESGLNRIHALQLMETTSNQGLAIGGAVVRTNATTAGRASDTGLQDNGFDKLNRLVKRLEECLDIGQLTSDCASDLSVSPYVSAWLADVVSVFKYILDRNGRISR